MEAATDKVEFKNKNDFTCVAWQGSRKVMTHIRVNKIHDFTNYLERHNIEWSCVRVYARRTERYLKSFYRKYDLHSIPARVS